MDGESDLLRMLDATFGDQFADDHASLPSHPTARYATRRVETISRVVVHHSATRPDVSWTAIARYHVENKDHQWPGIGYHFGVEPNGTVVYVGDVGTIRYHARQANTTSIGVCCLGDYGKVQPSAPLLESLHRLIGVLSRWRSRWVGAGLAVSGHRDECETDCPGNALYAALGKLNGKESGMIDDPSVAWDPNLNDVRVEDNVVRALRCGRWQPADLQPGQTYYRIANAAFIDEQAARGRHVISVDVIDEIGNRIQGAKVWHGWPTQRWPEYDERVEETVFGSQIAEWGLYADFDAWRDPGPYWVTCADGPSETFWGAGLPWKRHVCFAVVFQRAVWQPEPMGTLDEVLIARGQQEQAIQFNPGAALQQRIFADSFVPNSPEFAVEHNGVSYVAQRAEHLATGVVRVYYAVRGVWDRVLYAVIPSA